VAGIVVNDRDRNRLEIGSQLAALVKLPQILVDVDGVRRQPPRILGAQDSGIILDQGQAARGRAGDHGEPAVDQRQERRVLYFVFFAAGLLAGGIVVGYFVALPAAVHYLTNFD